MEQNAEVQQRRDRKPKARESRSSTSCAWPYLYVITGAKDIRDIKTRTAAAAHTHTDTHRNRVIDQAAKCPITYHKQIHS